MDSKDNVQSNGGSVEESQAETSLINIIRTPDNQIKMKQTIPNQQVEELLRMFLLQYQRANWIDAVKMELAKTRIIRP